MSELPRPSTPLGWIIATATMIYSIIAVPYLLIPGFKGFVESIPMIGPAIQIYSGLYIACLIPFAVWAWIKAL